MSRRQIAIVPMQRRDLCHVEETQLEHACFRGGPVHPSAAGVRLAARAGGKAQGINRGGEPS